jgi:6-phospho-3-hexuloisomerase
MSTGLPNPELDFPKLVRLAVSELGSNLLAIPDASITSLIEQIAAARRVAVYGVGREGLAMKGFAMRLFHMGVQAFVVGEMTAAAVGSGDLLIVSAGPGYFSTVSALASEAQRAGCKVVGFTSQPPSPIQDWANFIVQIPATCLPPASLLGQDPAHLHRIGSADGSHSILPMGSSYECALQLFFDLVSLLLQRRLGVAMESMKARHTNLE